MLIDLGAGFLGTFGPFSSDANGIVTAPVPIPNVPTVAGLTLYAQWAVYEFGTPDQLVLSNGLEVVVQP